MLFVCPKCKGRLTVREDGCAVCESRHSYDRSRDGYYNLLLSQGGKIHGDNKEMVLARRSFLDTGAYQPLADRIYEVASPYIRDGAKILDSGCGEGYYTDLLERKLREEKHGVELYGFDISRDAVRYAARKNKNLSLVVAGAYHIPVADESCDLIFSIFAPLAREEFLRALRCGGYFVMVIPDENHLFGLKSILYKTPYKNTVEDTALDGFTLVSTERVAFTLSLDSKEKIRSLFMMTPYAYRTPREACDRIFSLDSLETEAEFIIFLYRKNQYTKTLENGAPL